MTMWTGWRKLGSSINGAASAVAYGLGTFLDGAVGIFDPVAAERRRMTRWAGRQLRQLRAGHEAAGKDRTVNDWRDKGGSADQFNLPDLATITNRARESQRDDWCGRSIVNGYVRNVVGCGIMPMASAVDEGGAARADFNKQANRLFRRWARRKKRVDVEGRKTFAQFQRLVEREFVTTGQALIVWSYTPRPDTVGLKLQLFELEQLATEDECTPATGNEIRGGVEVDPRDGRPVAYWIHTATHPQEGFDPSTRVSDRLLGTKPTRIPAERVFHVQQQGRVRETLSTSRLVAVLRKMHAQKRYDDQEQFAKGLEAFLAFVISRDPRWGTDQIAFNPPTGATPGPGGGDSADKGGNRQLDFQPGMVPTLFPGEKIEMFNPQRPGAIYGEYTDRQVGMIGAGSDLSFATVARDYSKGNFSSQRQGRLEDEKAFDIDQQDLVDAFLRPLWELFIALAIMEGKLSAPGAVAPSRQGAFAGTPAEIIDESWLEVDWKYPARPWVDPAKHAAAAKLSRDYLIETLEQQVPDWRDRLTKIKEIRDFAEGLDITLPEFAVLEETGKPAVSPSEPKPRGKSAKPKLNGRLADEIILAGLRDEED